MQVSIREVRLFPVEYVKAVLRHMGPEFPFYISWVWATGEIFPSYRWLEMNPTQAGSYLDHTVKWAARSWEFILGAIVIGPLLGGGTVLYDDYFDRIIDRDNPRKNTLPFQKSPARPGTIIAAGIALFAISLTLASMISWVFLAIAILYSTPPIRLKGRGGLDLVTNMIGFGILCSLAGYSLGASLSTYPWLWLIPMVLGTGALYVPTTVADIYSDGMNGVKTIAVKLGIPKAMKVAILLLILANIGILSLGLFDYLYSPGTVYRLWPLSILELIPLLYLLESQEIGDVIKVLFATSSLMAVGTFLLALNHVGIWQV
jgi:4-hydroxybenzoate polyprenyltransferase